MKVLIASDIHGIVECIKKLNERIEVEKPDEIVFLGDLLFNSLGDSGDKVLAINLLNKYSDKVRAVKGNCDSMFDNMQFDFTVEMSHLLLSYDGINIFATHGDYYNMGNLPALSSFDILLHGHTHLPAFEKIEKGKFYINPGSVSIPHGNTKHSYLIYENKMFIWKDLDGKVYREEMVDC